MADYVIAIDDPRADDVRGLLARHLELMNLHSPPEDVHALDVDGLLDPAVTFYSLRQGGGLLAVGALKQLDDRHGELKSMHTAAQMRGRGIGRIMLTHLVDVATAEPRNSDQWVSRRTGRLPDICIMHPLAHRSQG